MLWKFQIIENAFLQFFEEFWHVAIHDVMNHKGNIHIHFGILLEEESPR